MILFLFACTTPEKAATNYTETICSYLESCQILNAFDYADTEQCLSEQHPDTVTEDNLDLLQDCTDSLLEADCAAVYEEELQITAQCTTWFEATEPPTASQD